MVRLHRTTRAKLQQLADVWEGAYKRGVEGVPVPNDDGKIPLTAIIEELIRRNAAKMERSRKSSRRANDLTSADNKVKGSEDAADKTEARP